MGYLSCRADSAVITCESYKRERVARPPVQLFSYKQLEAATGGFASEFLLGKGSHGSVYKGLLADGTLVAVKRPSTGMRRLQDDSAVENEIEILSKINSPRFVNLLGFSHDTREKLLVVEFMSNGTLHDVLHSCPEPPAWPRRVRFALQTAKAIYSLHSACPPVIHRDVKSSNVLIDANWNARLGDFGLALRGHVEEIKLNSTPPAGTIGYLDPGYVTPGNLSMKNDVFSFGILLLEIISGRNAIDVQYSPPSIVEWALPLIRQNKSIEIFDPRLPLPKNADSVRKVALIAARCVRSSEEKRPSIKDVVEGLKHVSRSLPAHLWNGLRKPKKQQVLVSSSAKQAKIKEKEKMHVNRTSLGISTEEQIPLRSLGIKPSRSSTRVSDETPPQIPNSRVSRRGSGRNLVDLFKEAKEDLNSSKESVEGVPSPTVSMLKQGSVVRRSPTVSSLRADLLPVLGEHHRIGRNHSSGSVRKPRLLIDPSQPLKPRPQVSTSFSPRRTLRTEIASFDP